MIRELKELELSELISIQTLRSCEKLGSGCEMRMIIQEAMVLAIQWKRDRDEKENIKSS